MLEVLCSRFWVVLVGLTARGIINHTAGCEMTVDVVHQNAAAEVRRQSLELRKKREDGRRWAAARDCTSARATVVMWTMQCLVLERVRALTRFFLRASMEAPGDGCSSLVLDYLNDFYSPSVEALQHIRHLGSGWSPRLALFYGKLGYTSMLELRQSPEDSHYSVQMTTLARAVSAAVYRRIDKPRREFPLYGAGLVDGRYDDATRAEISKTIMAAPGCCRGRFWDMMIGPNIQGPPDCLLQPRLQLAIASWLAILETALSIAQRGRQNKRAKTVLTAPNMKYDNFAAAHFLQEVSAKCQSAVEQATTRAKQAGEDQVPLAPKPRKLPRGMSAYGIYIK